MHDDCFSSPATSPQINGNACLRCIKIPMTLTCSPEAWPRILTMEPFLVPLLHVSMANSSVSWNTETATFSLTTQMCHQGWQISKRWTSNTAIWAIFCATTQTLQKPRWMCSSWCLPEDTVPKTTKSMHNSLPLINRHQIFCTISNTLHKYKP